VVSSPEFEIAAIIGVKMGAHCIHNDDGPTQCRSWNNRRVDASDNLSDV
jgi:hypothetical protein